MSFIYLSVIYTYTFEYYQFLGFTLFFGRAVVVFIAPAAAQSATWGLKNGKI